VNDDGRVVETTFDRRAYVGLALPAGIPTLRFALGHDSAHLKAVLADGGARAQEITNMIRTARAVLDGAD
jgi:hypothetical protein